MLTQKILTLLFSLLFVTGMAESQDLTLNIQGTPEMIIDGDSNVKSWDADVTQMDGTLRLQNVESVIPGNLTPESFNNLSITIPVKGIESSSGGLTSNIHKYLKEKDHPNITFELNDVTNIAEENGSYIITASGTVTAAGKKNNIDMKVTANIQNEGIQFSGEKELLMTDFDIDPPTAVFGTVRSKDEFTVKFDITFNN